MLQTKQVIDVPNEGLVSLLDSVITLFCANYIYTGKLVGVNEDCVKLEKPSIVYETGAFSEKQWKDVQSLPNQIYVMKTSIESFGIVK
mgnify:CR=1 FL=1